VEDWIGTSRSSAVDLEAAVLTLAAAYFLGFPGAGLVPAVDLGFELLGTVAFLVAVNLGCVGASVTS